MSLLAAVLLLWGFTLDPATAYMSIHTDTEPSLWAEPQSLEKPWANLTLTCEADTLTRDFQLILNGWPKTEVNLDKHVMSYKFSLGAITSKNMGLYRCRYSVDIFVPITNLTEMHKWSMLSNLVEVTGKEPLPQPWLSTAPASWIIPSMGTYLLCKTPLLGVTFVVKQEKEGGLVRSTKAQRKGTAYFSVFTPGRYSCRYQTHDTGELSEPSDIVTINELARPPPPTLYFMENYPMVKHQSTPETLGCRAPVNAAEIQLRLGEKVLDFPRVCFVRYFCLFHLNFKHLDGQGPFTCRYLIHRKLELWSEDSKPIELMWTDEKLMAPMLIVKPSKEIFMPRSTVHFLCSAPKGKTGLSFGLQRQGQHHRFSLVQMLKTAGTQAVFELSNLSTIDSGNYSCIYMEQTPPFSGSPSSEIVQLRVGGPPPRPKLEALWTGKVALGRDAHFLCHGHVHKVTIDLVKEGSEMPSSISYAITSTSAILKLVSVGPQHRGNYSCRYASMSPFSFKSGNSNPVELLVEDS